MFHDFFQRPVVADKFVDVYKRQARNTASTYRPCNTVFHTPSSMSHKQIRSAENSSSHALTVAKMCIRDSNKFEFELNLKPNTELITIIGDERLLGRCV